MGEDVGWKGTGSSDVAESVAWLFTPAAGSPCVLGLGFFGIGINYPPPTRPDVCGVQVITFFVVYKGARWWWLRRKERRAEAARVAAAVARGEDPAAPLLADGSVDADSEAVAVAVAQSPEGTAVHIAVAADPEGPGAVVEGQDAAASAAGPPPASVTGQRPNGDEV